MTLLDRKTTNTGEIADMKAREDLSLSFIETKLTGAV